MDMTSCHYTKLKLNIFKSKTEDRTDPGNFTITNVPFSSKYSVRQKISKMPRFVANVDFLAVSINIE